MSLTDTSTISEEHTTQSSEEENQWNAAESSVVVNLPAGAHYPQRPPLSRNTGQETMERLDILSVSLSFFLFSLYALAL
jgi:hypothetical protein